MASHTVTGGRNSETQNWGVLVPFERESVSPYQRHRPLDMQSEVATGSTKTSKRQILLVEDDQGHVMLITRAFRSFADTMELTAVSTLEEAKELIDRFKYDLIITDLKLPDGNGTELLPGNMDSANIPAIVMTSHGGEKLAVESLKLGALDYIVKSSENMANIPREAIRALREWGHIAERKRAEAELHLTNSILRTQQETTIDGILVVDGRGRIISHNQRFLDMWAITEEMIASGSDEEVLGVAITQLVYPEEFINKVNYLYEHPTEKNQEEIELLDGRTFERYSAPMFGPDRQYYGRVWYFRDITERKRAEAELRTSENRLRMVLDVTSGGVWDRNLQADEVYYGLNWANMLGYSPDEIEPNTRFWNSLVHPDDREQAISSLQAHIDGQCSHYKAEFRMRAKNGNWKWVLSRGKVVERDAEGTPIRILGTHTDISDRKLAEKKIREINLQLEQRVTDRTAELLRANERLSHEIHERKCLERELLSISERDQRWIGQELHDSLGQQLTGIAMMSKVLEHKLSGKSLPEIKDAAEITSMVNKAIDKTRSLAKGLHPVDLDLNGLTEALGRLAVNTAHLFDIECEFGSDGNIEIFDNMTSVNLYRVAQEAVTNAVRHGKAAKIHISLSCQGEKGSLSIENDGLDFPDLPAKRKGMGLRIMNYRASMIEGAFDIRRGSNGGTIVTCTFLNRSDAGENQYCLEERQGTSDEKRTEKI